MDDEIIEQVKYTKFQVFIYFLLYLFTVIPLLTPRGGLFPIVFEGSLTEWGLLEGGGALCQISTKNIFSFIYDLVLNKIKKRTSAVTTEL